MPNESETVVSVPVCGANLDVRHWLSTTSYAVIVRLKAEGALDENCLHRPVPYLNNVLEQDHRANALILMA
jgi:hypothetical protein